MNKEEKLKEVDPERKQAEEDAERAAEAELTQAAAEFEREAQAHRKQAERVRRVSYLKGTTPRCTNCNKNRVTFVEDLLCYACQELAKTAELVAELKNLTITGASTGSPTMRLCVGNVPRRSQRIALAVSSSPR